MKRLKKLFLVFALIFILGLLTGCIKKDSNTLFVRQVATEYQLIFNEGDSKDFVSKDILLEESYRGVLIKWTSSNPEIIDEKGKVQIPAETTKVKLTASFEIDGKIEKAYYEVVAASKEEIYLKEYNTALTAIQFLEARNSKETYLNAKNNMEKVSETNPHYEELNRRFLTQETLYLAKQAVKAFKEMPSSANLAVAQPLVNKLTEEVIEKPRLQSDIDSNKTYTEKVDSALEAIEVKTKEAVTSALALVEAIPSYLSYRTELMAKLGELNKYFEQIEVLDQNTITQTNLEKLILEEKVLEDVLSNAQIEELNQKLIQNQTRLFSAKADLGKAYLEKKLSDFENEPSPAKEALLHMMLDAYQGENKALRKAEFIASILKDDNLDNDLITKLEEVSVEITDANLKEEYQTKAKDFRLKLSINELLEKLNLFVDSNEFEFLIHKEKLDEITAKVEALTSEESKTYYEEKLDNHNLLNSAYNQALALENIEIDSLNIADNTTVKAVSDAKDSKNAVTAFAPKVSKKIDEIIEKNILVILSKLEERLEDKNERVDAINYRSILSRAENKDYEQFRNKQYIEKVANRQEAVQTRIKRTTIFFIFLAIVLYLIYHASVYEYAIKKGYEGLQWGLLALVPVVGLVYFIKAEKRRNTSKAGFKALYKPSELLSKFLIYAELVIITVIVLIPIIYIFGMAFSNQQGEIPNRIWPKEPNAKAFTYLFKQTKFGTWWLNTLFIAIINMIVGTLVITGASYVFARFSFKGKKAGLLTILVLQSFPTFMGLIAMFVLFWKFGLLGKPIALTILYIGGGIPGNIWLIKGFLDQIPKDLDESAMIDGANKLQIFVRIIMPLSIPILTFVAVNLFMAPWMDYMLPSYLLNVPPAGAAIDYDVSQQWTLAVGLFDLINGNEIHYAAFAAGALIVGGPITLLYMFFQKYLIEGIMAGATKG